MKKRFLSLICALALVCAVLPAPALATDATFNDVYGDSWFRDDVKFVFQNNLMGGTGSGSFSPNANVTRGMLVTILHRIEGQPFAVASDFTDIPVDAYYTDAVNWAAEQGIVNGKSNGIFAPNDSISREELAVILYRCAEKSGCDTDDRADLSAFSDSSSVSSFAVDSLSWAVSMKLINGSDNRLNPKGSATRAQCAAILHRYCEQVINFTPAANKPDFLPAEYQDILFEQLSGLTFNFGSGIGGWWTTLNINADGSFTGTYHDSNMGETGKGYPGGTVYICEFSGNFWDVKKISDFEYSMQLGPFRYDTPGQETIIDGILYITAEPYGLDNAGEFRVYLPGIATSGLPNEFILWVRSPNDWGLENPPTLPFWGLYNVGGQEGFFSSK